MNNSRVANLRFRISRKWSLTHGLVIVLLLIFTGCRSGQLNSDSVNQGTIDMTNATSMNRDAVRVIVKVDQINEPGDKQNGFDVVLKKVVKYGATFSSIEPKIGQILRLSTPPDVTFQKGDVILLDILTPRLGGGERPLKVRMG